MNRQKVKDFILTRLKQKKPHELHPISRVPLCRLQPAFSNRVKRWRSPKDTEELERMLFSVRSGFSSSGNPAMREKILKEKQELSNNDTFVLNNTDFIEGLVLKSYRHRLMGKVVNPAFEEFIDRLGRYENYPCRNIIFSILI